jgi:hypothetical protein
MEQRLQDILSELKNIQVSLRKLGIEKRLERKSYVQQKIDKAKSLYIEYENIISTLDITVLQESAYIFDLVVEQTDIVYKKILCFGTQKIDTKTPTMDKFDIKTAATLIPIMDGTQEVTERIIDGIEMYETCLESDNCKKMLISFILKTRVNKSAKLKLKQKYESITELILDMKTYLLTKKSASSLLSQLSNITQRDMSVKEFGDAIEDMFVNLTISQANNNENAYEILRPLNESMAVKRFADGLRNRRLGTVISARDYGNLKDAIRAAEDEESAQRPSQSILFNYVNRGKSNYRPGPNYQGYVNRGHRGYYSHRGTSVGRGTFGQRGYQYHSNRYMHQPHHYRPPLAPYRNPRGRFGSNRAYRGGRGNHHQIYSATSGGSNNTHSSEINTPPENETLNGIQFFRA